MPVRVATLPIGSPGGACAEAGDAGEGAGDGDAAGRAVHAPDFVETHLANLLHDGAECATCHWQTVCAGYFKWPDPTYDCAGVKQLFATLEAAAAEITRDLASQETPSAP